MSLYFMKGGELGYTIVKPNAITSSRIVKTNIPNVKLEHFSKKDQLKIKRFGKKKPKKKYGNQRPKATPVGPRAEEPTPNAPPKAKRAKAPSKAPSEASIESVKPERFDPVEKVKVGKKSFAVTPAPSKKVKATEEEAEQLFIDGKITSAQLDEINGGLGHGKVFPLYSFPRTPRTKSESVTRDQQKLPSHIQQQIIDFRQSSLKQKKATLSQILKTGGLAHWYEAGNKEGHPFTKSDLEQATDDDCDEMFKQDKAARYLHDIAPQVAKVEGIKPSEVDIGIAGLHPPPVKKIPRYLKKEPKAEPNMPVNRVLTEEEINEMEQKSNENAFVHQQLATRQKELTDIELDKQTQALARHEAPKKGKRPPPSKLKAKAEPVVEPKRRGRPPKVVPVKAEATKEPVSPLAPLQPVGSPRHPIGPPLPLSAFPPKKTRPPPKKYKLKPGVVAKVEPLVKQISRDPVDPVRNKSMIAELKAIAVAEDKRLRKSLAKEPKLPRGAAPKPPDAADELLDALRYYTNVATPRDADPAKVLEAVEEMNRILEQNKLPRPPTPRKGRPPKVSPVKAEATKEPKGRPFKITPVKSEATEEAPSPRKRGRPPKIAPVKAEATKEPSSPLAPLQLVAEPSPKSRPAPSKRKTKVEQVAEKETPTPREHASELVEVSPPKKRPAPKRLKAKSQPAQPILPLEPVESPLVLPLGTEIERTPSKQRPPRPQPSRLKAKVEAKTNEDALAEAKALEEAKKTKRKETKAKVFAETQAKNRQAKLKKVSTQLGPLDSDKDEDVEYEGKHYILHKDQVYSFEGKHVGKLTEEGDIIFFTPEPVVEPVAPKKKGRPPKVTPVKIEATAEVPSPRKRERPSKVTPVKDPYEQPLASPISKQLLDEIGSFTQERHLGARKEKQDNRSVDIYIQNRHLIKEALRAAEEAKSRPAPPRRRHSVAEAPKEKLPPKRTKSVAPDSRWVKMQLTSVENEMIQDRLQNQTKLMTEKEIRELEQEIELVKYDWRQANKKYLKDSTAERILRDQPTAVTKLLFKKPQSMLLKDTAELKEKKQAEEKANEEYDYALVEAQESEEKLKALPEKIMKMSKSEVKKLSRNERMTMMSTLSEEIEPGELAVIKAHLFPGEAGLPEDFPSPRRTLDIREKILEAKQLREQEQARVLADLKEQRRVTALKKQQQEAARLQKEATAELSKSAEKVKAEKAAETAYFKEYLRNQSVDDVLPIDLIHAQPLTEEVVAHKMWKTKLDLLKNAGIKFKDYKANPDLKTAIDLIMARAHERDVKHKLEHPDEEITEEEKQQRLDDEQRVRTLWEQSLAATIADSDEEEEPFDLYDPMAQLEAENEETFGRSDSDDDRPLGLLLKKKIKEEDLPLGDVELEESESESESESEEEKPEYEKAGYDPDAEYDAEAYYAKNPEEEQFDPFEVPYEEPPSPASTEVSFGSTASPYTPRSPERYDIEGSGLNFGKLKWGSFSRQLKDYNKKHSSKLSLEQFAHAVISSPKHFDKRTQKRARFYLDILLHQKGKGLELKSHHNNIMPMLHSVRHSVQHPAMASPHPDFVLTPNAQANIAAFNGGSLRDDMSHMYHRVVPKSMRSSVEHLARETGKQVLRHPEVKKARKQIRAKYESIVPAEMRPAIAKVAYSGLHHAMEGNGMECGSLKTRMQKTFNKVVPNKKIRESLVDLGKTATREVVNSAPVTKIRRKVRDEYNKAVPQALKDPLEDLGRATLAYGKRKAGYGRGLKGSQEMKDKMARLRAMKKSRGGAIPAPPSRSYITDPSLL